MRAVPIRVGQKQGAYDPAALKVAQAVKQAASPGHVILFGSRARGDYRTDSDIDLLIIDNFQVSEGHKEHLDDIASRAAEMLHPQAPAADLAFMTGEQFLRERLKVNSLPIRQRNTESTLCLRDRKTPATNTRLNSRKQDATGGISTTEQRMPGDSVSALSG